MGRHLAIKNYIATHMAMKIKLEDIWQCELNWKTSGNVN